MTTIRQKELEFLRKLKKRFTNYDDYKGAITDMATEGLISAAAVNKVLAGIPVNNILVDDKVLFKITKKQSSTAKRKKPFDDPCTRTPPVGTGGCSGGSWSRGC